MKSLLPGANWRNSIDAVASIFMIFASVAILWVTLFKEIRPLGSSTTGDLLPTEPIDLSGGRRLGDPGAPLVAIVFSDFQCPFCRRFAGTTFKSVVNRYVSEGQVEVAFRDFPITRIHKHAAMAAKIARCAEAQGKFWPAHDAIFFFADDLDRGLFASAFRAAKLDELSVSQCVDRTPDDSYLDDVRLGRTLGVAGTPTLVLGRRQGPKVRPLKRISGDPGFESLSKTLDSLLRTPQ